jgi:hypothetical protein
MTKKKKKTNFILNLSNAFTSTIIRGTFQRFLRPRFLADEISRKKKVCVAIVVSTVDSLETRAAFLNNLLKEHVDKVSILPTF